MPPFEPLGLTTSDRDLWALEELARRADHGNRFSPTVFVEVGSWAGATARVLVNALATHQPTLYCVDTWQGSTNVNDLTHGLARELPPGKILETFCRNLEAYIPGLVVPLVGESLFWAERFLASGLQADLVFIDADHGYDAVKGDILAWKQVVRVGGILCGHDYRVWEGVTQAVDELYPARGLAGDSIWCVEVE